MAEHVGFQVAPPKQEQQQQQGAAPTPAEPPSFSQFIVDDLKLFVSPVTAVVNEFRRQLKRD
jgi:hypothetical protein